MPLKEADKVRAQILALLDVSNVEQYIAAVYREKGGTRRFGEDAAIRAYAAFLRKQIGQGATDSSFAVC